MWGAIQVIAGALILFAAIKFFGLVGLIIVLCVMGFLLTQEYK